jgi:cation:H+ antiporter
MIDYAALLLGIVFAATGGELFVRGTVGLAHAVRVSPGIIGATVAAFATSSPELTVSINSALAGTPKIALGDALGSNIVNVALILAAVLLIAPLHAPRDSTRRDFPVALIVPIATGVLMLDGVISRLDGLMLLGLFAAWLVAVVWEVRRQRSAAEKVLGEPKTVQAVVYSALGLALLIAAGKLIVVGASGVAKAYGVDEFVVGATVVAVGTSAPELATAVVSRIRGHDEIGLGTILGSNIFNGLFIVGVAATITPIAIPWREAAVALTIGLAALALVVPSRSGVIERRRGMLLLGLYVVYLAAVVHARS